MMRSLTLYILATATPPTLAQTAIQLFRFTEAVSIENSVLRPDGNILFTTLDQNHLFSLDPNTAHPEAEIVVSFPGITATNGIAAIGLDKFAMLGGVREQDFYYTNETLYTVDFTDGATVEIVATFPNAIMLNGLASLPANPHTVLISDSRAGTLLRVDIETGEITTVLRDEILSPPLTGPVPIGINGVKVVGGYVYFTVTGRGVFARALIDNDGFVVSGVEVIAHAPGRNGWDDFAFGGDGSVYLCLDDDSLTRIKPDGGQDVVFGGNSSTAILGPSSVTVREDGRALYVTTRGGTVDGVVSGGQVVEIHPLNKVCELT